MNKKIFNWLIGIAIILSAIVTIGFYANTFDGELSNNSQDWSSFGSYISGILTPVLTVLNIVVFIKLTQTIAAESTKRDNKKDSEQKKREDDKIKQQEIRHKKELEHQKRLLITQLRQDELTQLSNSLNNIGNGSTLLEIRVNVTHAGTIIDSFTKQKQVLFPLEHNKKAYEDLIELHNKVMELNKNLEDSVYITGLSTILKLKHKVMSELQKYIIDNI